MLAPISLHAALILLASADAGFEFGSAAALDQISVVGRSASGIGLALSASEGSVGADEIAARPLLRVGDVIELVPGLVATQHSGSGKANQYFLRGFNLDHGTDFATYVDGMPVNLRSHGHGQGYTDLNFLIPELVQALNYSKGPYHAGIGDFSSAGSAELLLADRVADRIEIAAGELGDRRGVLSTDLAVAGGDLLFGAELHRRNGAWTDIDEDLDRRNAVLRYSRDSARGRGHLMLMHYRGDWNSADQIPQRAVEQGLVERFGSLDDSLGGRTRRSSLSGGWSGLIGESELRVRAYAVDYDFRLWSNFTYFLDDPERGDQFQQFDARRYYGGDLQQHWHSGRSTWTLGADARFDDIKDVGLRRSRARQLLQDIRRDAVEQSSLGLHAQHEFQWTPRLRSVFGLRGDFHRFEVDSALPANSGRRKAHQYSPKASLAYLASEGLELYASAGRGLHSNDARGTTLRVDPLSGEAADAVDPLVASRGAELGLRWQPQPQWHTSAALWRLELDSELLFVGDAGNTEATRASERHGLELGVYWDSGARLAADLELGWTRARFSDPDPAGREIPGALPFVASFSLRYEGPANTFAQARWRHFGRYPLVEDDSVRSAGSDIVHLRLGRRFERWTLALDVLNLFDSGDRDIEYFYASRLPGEPADGIEDRHFHPFEPRALRLSLGYRFD
jgi:outer membrane receptor protein involved in Fe transport